MRMPPARTFHGICRTLRVTVKSSERNMTSSEQNPAGVSREARSSCGCVSYGVTVTRRSPFDHMASSTCRQPPSMSQKRTLLRYSSISAFGPSTDVYRYRSARTSRGTGNV
ncbi:hypothetical protein SALBM311S_04829 [Streptomyces alboniger]